jgi:DNA invertase Pin-like site-specific DNA recombinase
MSAQAGADKRSLSTLAPVQQNEARERLEAGESQRSVARSYNVTQSTISRLPMS